MNRFLMTAALGLLLAGGAVRDASAQVYLTPFAGMTFGDDAPASKFNVGAGLTFMGNVAGFEIDFGYSPDFFGDENTIVPENNVVTLMGNLVLNAPIGGSGRVYLSGGGGLLRSQVDDTNDFFDVDRNDFGVNAGAGIVVPLGERFGLRGDIRYFRNIGDDEPDNEFDLDFGSFDFWRGTAGLSIIF